MVNKKVKTLFNFLLSKELKKTFNLLDEIYDRFESKYNFYLILEIIMFIDFFTTHCSNVHIVIKKDKNKFLFSYLVHQFANDNVKYKHYASIAFLKMRKWNQL